MGVHGKTIFDWPRNLEYQDIHFDIVSGYWGGAMDWPNFLKKHTSMKRPSAVTKDIIRESANILFEYEILDAELSKPGKEYAYFVNNAEVRVVHKSAEQLPSPMHFDAGDLYVGVFSGSDDDSFVSWIESDIQPRYSVWEYAGVKGRWSPDSYSQDELPEALLGKVTTGTPIVHNKEVRDMKIHEVKDIKLGDKLYKIKRVV